MIRLENVTYTYPDGNIAIDNLSVEIKKSESVALIGANGAGKTTLLNLLVCVLLPQKGRIFVDGTEVRKESLAAVRAKMGMVFQNPDEQLFMTTAREDIAFGPQNMGYTEEQTKEAVEEVSELLGIPHLLDRMPHKLSGGEKRLVEVASVLVYEPDVLLFDEPISFLDPRARKNMIGVLKSLLQTKLIATHDLDMAMDICTRILILDHGRIAADGGAELLRDEALLQNCGLELPLGLGRR